MLGNAPVRRNCDLVNADEVGESLAAGLDLDDDTDDTHRVGSAALLFSAFSIRGPTAFEGPLSLFNRTLNLVSLSTSRIPSERTNGSLSPCRQPDKHHPLLPIFN